MVVQRVAPLDRLVSDIAALVTAIAALLAAGGALVAAVYSNRSKKHIEKTNLELMGLRNEIAELGRRIDGRMAELLTASKDLARAEGHAEGIAAEQHRDDPSNEQLREDAPR